jgi:YD repeat-containing protein
MLTKTNSVGTTSYTWDFENRLTAVTLPGNSGVVTIKYDPFGRRVNKSSSSGNSIYTYDGDNLVEETNIYDNATGVKKPVWMKPQVPS